MHKDPLQYAFAGREGREEGFSPEGQEFMPVFDASHVDLVLSAHLHTYRDRGRIYDFRRAETGTFAISLPGWPGMCAIRGCGKHIRWTSILHHSRKPIITLSWKREKMLLLLQAILRTGRKCISPL